MKYDELKNFILNEMDMRPGKNYQPVMIKALNQNQGKISKDDLKVALQKANPEYELSYFTNCPAFTALTETHPVTRYDQQSKIFYLLDYESYNDAEKAWITNYCEKEIEKQTSTKYFVLKDLNEIQQAYQIFVRNLRKTTLKKDKITLGFPGPEKNVEAEAEYSKTGELPVIDQGQDFVGGFTNKSELKVNCNLPVIIFGDHTKNIKFVDREFVAGADGVKVLEPKNPLISKLIYYFVQAIPIPAKGYARHYQFLAKSMIRIPPLKEQKKIVEKIEELFLELDFLNHKLEKIKNLLKSYRQSLLKSAFNGNLVKRLETNVEFIEVQKIGKIITGNTPSTKNSLLYGDQIPFFKPTDLNDGFFVNKSKQKLSSKGLLESRFIPKKSVLVTSIGATIGKIGFSRVDGASNQQINSIVPNSNLIIPEFLYFICSSPQFQKSILDNSSATTLPIINKSRFSKLKIPLFSIEDQKLMLSQIEQEFLLIKTIENMVNSILSQLNVLYSTILKQAFEGKLVPQDPNDESSEILLQKIKNNKK